MTANQDSCCGIARCKKTIFVLACLLIAAGALNVYLSSKTSNVRPRKSEIHIKPAQLERTSWPRETSKNVTLVTAFFNLGTIVKGIETNLRDRETYKHWFATYAYIENAVAAYFDDDDMAQHFAKLRQGKPSRITMIDRNNLWAFSLQNRTQSIFDEPGYPRNPPKSTNAAYACAMHAKYELLARTIEEDPFNSTYVAWLDAGFFRGLTDSEKEIPFGINAPKCYQEGTVAACMVYPLTEGSTVEDIVRNGADWVAGGLLLAKAETMLKFCRDYMRRAEDLLDRGLANHDQSVIFSMYAPSSNWKASVPLQTFEGLNPDPWFYLGYLLRAEWLSEVATPEARGPGRGFHCSYKVFT